MLRISLKMMAFTLVCVGMVSLINAQRVYLRCEANLVCNQTNYRTNGDNWSNGLRLSANIETIDKDLLVCVEPSYPCSSLRGVNQTDGTVTVEKDTGVYVSLGINLGMFKAEEFEEILKLNNGLLFTRRSSIMKSFNLYFGLNGVEAEDLVKKAPLELSPAISNEIAKAFRIRTTKMFIDKYNAEKVEKAMEFKDLPWAIMNAMYSLFWQQVNGGVNSASLQEIWSAFVKNDWNRMIELYTTSTLPDARRRHVEYQLILGAAPGQKTKLDVIIIHDTPASKEAYEDARTLMRNVAFTYNIAENETRFGYYIYGNEPHLVMPLTDGVFPNIVEAAVNHTEEHVEGRRLGEALLKAMSDADKHERIKNGIPLVILVLTEGPTEPSDQAQFQNAIVEAKARGVQVIVASHSNKDEPKEVYDLVKHRIERLLHTGGAVTRLQPNIISLLSFAEVEVSAANKGEISAVIDGMRPRTFTYQTVANQPLELFFNVKGAKKNELKVYVSMTQPFPNQFIAEMANVEVVESAVKKISIPGMKDDGHAYVTVVGPALTAFTISRTAEIPNPEPVKNDTKPVEPVKNDTKPVEPVKNDTKPVEPVKNDTKPVEPAKNDTKPVEPVKNDTKSVEPVKNDTKPVEPVKNDTKPVEPVKNDTKPVEPVKNDTKPVEPVKDETKKDDTKPAPVDQTKKDPEPIKPTDGGKTGQPTDPVKPGQKDDKTPTPLDPSKPDGSKPGVQSGQATPTGGEVPKGSKQRPAGLNPWLVVFIVTAAVMGPILVLLYWRRRTLIKTKELEQLELDFEKDTGTNKLL